MGTSVTGRGRAPTPAGLIEALRASGFAVGPAHRETTTVLDTFDGRLHDARLRLEHRGNVLSLHGGGGGSASVHVDARPRVAADLAPGPMRSRLQVLIEPRALLPCASISSTRHRAERRNGTAKVVATVEIHDGVSVDGRPVMGWLVEVGELTGYAEQAAAARDLVREHVDDATEGDAVALGLALVGVGLGGRDVGPGVALAADLPAIEGFRLVLANLADAIDLNRPGTIADVDPEFLHDLRVAVRRTRSVLRHGRHVLSPELLAWAEPGLSAVGQLTGPPRDLDVQVIEWDERVRALDADDVAALDPLHLQLLRDRQRAQSDLAEALRAGVSADLLARWSSVVHAPMDPATGGAQAAVALATVVGDRIERAQRQLLDHGRAIRPETPAEHVHEVRKDAKRLRYLLECFADLYEPVARGAFVKRLKRLQEVLGTHQDADVQAAQLRVAASELPDDTGTDSLLAIGRLIEQLDRRQRSAREQFTDRFADYDRRSTRRALRSMLDGAAT